MCTTCNTPALQLTVPCIGREMRRWITQINEEIARADRYILQRPAGNQRDQRRAWVTAALLMTSSAGMGGRYDPTAVGRRAGKRGLGWVVVAVV